MVSGNLTLHGVTKQISFPAQIQVSDQAVEVDAQFVLNRFDFEIKYPGKANDLIRKEVVMQFKIKAAPGKATFAAAGL
jgi:polyisoprenoid-binding protein YceI